MATSSSYTAQASESLEQVLKSIEAKLPDSFPERGLKLFEPGEIAEKTDAELVKLLEYWNPVLGNQAAKELGQRGLKNLSSIRELSKSSNRLTRVSAARAIVSIFENILAPDKNSETPRPNADDAKKIIKNNDFINDLKRFSTDENRDVRRIAANGLRYCNGVSKEAIIMLIELASDQDYHVAEDTIKILYKSFGSEVKPGSDLVEAVQHVLSSPLPRGKGSAVSIIQRFKKDDQKIFLPFLLDRVRWEPSRDGMFSADGLKASIKILKDHNHKDLPKAFIDSMHVELRGFNSFEFAMEELKKLPKSVLVEHKPLLEKKADHLQEIAKIRRDRKSKRTLEKRVKLLEFIKTIN
jgi:hypothetical protein